MTFVRAVWLAAALLFTQIVLTAHGVGYPFGHDRDEDGSATVCVECLALSGMQDAPPPVRAAPSVAPHRVLPVPSAVPPAPTFARHLAFYSRAPPRLQS